jgi:hypothetical protein
VAPVVDALGDPEAPIFVDVHVGRVVEHRGLSPEGHLEIGVAGGAETIEWIAKKVAASGLRVLYMILIVGVCPVLWLTSNRDTSVERELRFFLII